MRTGLKNDSTIPNMQHSITQTHNTDSSPNIRLQTLVMLYRKASAVYFLFSNITHREHSGADALAIRHIR